VLAIATLAAVVVFWFAARRSPLPVRALRSVDVLVVAAVAQVGLGIATLVMIVPVSVAAAHQGGAVVLLTAALWATFELRPDRRRW